VAWRYIHGPVRSIRWALLRIISTRNPIHTPPPPQIPFNGSPTSHPTGLAVPMRKLMQVHSDNNNKKTILNGYKKKKN